MAFIPTPGACRFAVTQTLFGQDVVNTIWMDRTDEAVWTSANITIACSFLWSFWEGFIMTFLSNDITLVSVDGWSQDSDSAPVGSYSDTPVNGEIVSQSLPAQNAFVIKFGTGKRGRSYRGRNFIAGLPEVDVDDDKMDAGFIAALVGSFEGLNDVLDTANCRHIIVSHQHNGVVLEEGEITPVTYYEATSPGIRGQRRRQFGVGT